VTNLPSCICSKSAIFRWDMETWVPRFEQIKVPWNIGTSEDGLMGSKIRKGRGRQYRPYKGIRVAYKRCLSRGNILSIETNRERQRESDSAKMRVQPDDWPDSCEGAGR
jgi:hypothetical protein